MSTRRARLVFCSVASTALLVGCGGSTKGASTSGSPATGGKSFTVGYSVPTAQNPFLMSIEQAAVKTIAAAGGTVKFRDGQLNSNKQVSDLQEFISDGVDSVIVAPAIVPAAVKGKFAQARAAKIGVIAWDWEFSPNTLNGGPPAPPVQAQVTADRTNVGKGLADAIDSQFHGGGQVLYVGLPFPVNGTDQMFNTFQKELVAKGDKLVSRVNNGQDNAAGARPLVDGALTQYPNLNAVVTYNGGSAIGAYQATSSAGRKNVLIYNAQIDQSSVAPQKQGQIAEQWELNPVEMGVQLGKMAIAEHQKAPLSNWAKTITVPSQPYTPATIGQWESYDSRLAKLP